MEFFNNRYVQLSLLTLVIGLLIWALLSLILFTLKLEDFPLVLQLAIAFLGAGLLVYRFFANRIF